MTEVHGFVQIDLIDMKSDPSDQFKWILTVKDAFSKFLRLVELPDKQGKVSICSILSIPV
jgi:hypothetical protein